MSGDSDELRSLCARADSAPDDVGLQLAAAYACDRNGFEDDAVRYYDAAWRHSARISSDDRLEFLIGYGSTLRNVRRIDESLAVLRGAVAEYPDDLAAQAFLALTLHSRGDHATAMGTMLDVALRAGTDDGALRRFGRALAGYRDDLLVR